MTKRLLIADDDALFCSLLSNELVQKHGWDIRTAGAPDRAIAALEEHKPDLLLLDLRFGPGSGFDILDHIRAQNAPVRVVVVTNYPHSMYGQRCSDYGVLDYLVKTEWKIERLIEHIATLAE